MNTNELLTTIREQLIALHENVVDDCSNNFRKIEAALDQLEVQQTQAQAVGYTNKEEIATAQSGQISGGAFWLHATGHTNIPLYTNPQQPDIAKLAKERGLGHAFAVSVSDRLRAVIDGFERWRLVPASDEDLAELRKCAAMAEIMEDAAKSAAPAQQQPKPTALMDALELTASLTAQQPKRLTDEEIERIVLEDLTDNAHVGLGPTHDSALAIARTFAIRAMKIARDNGYIGGLSVEEVMHCLMGWAQIHYPYISKSSVGSLRKHLTAKAQGK